LPGTNGISCIATVSKHFFCSGTSRLPHVGLSADNVQQWRLDVAGHDVLQLVAADEHVVYFRAQVQQLFGLDLPPQPVYVVPVLLDVM